jgi:hypothetical protein
MLIWMLDMKRCPMRYLDPSNFSGSGQIVGASWKLRRESALEEHPWAQ